MGKAGREKVREVHKRKRGTEGGRNKGVEREGGEGEGKMVVWE